MPGIEINESCPACHGTGVVCFPVLNELPDVEKFCENCNGTGNRLLCFSTDLDSRLSDILDKVNDCLDKCNDIFEKVSE